jgi:hypothetical protein
MLRIIKTKDGKEFKSYTALHSQIVIDNKLNYSDVIGEYSVEFKNGKPIYYNVLRPLPDRLQLASDTEALYRYGFIKEGD